MTDDEIKQTFTRRALLLGGVQGLLLTTVIGRLYQLQILSGDHYQALSDKNRIHVRLIPPSRGQILDRAGRILATNSKSYRAVIVRDQAEDWQQLLKDVQPRLILSDDEIKRISTEIRRKPRFVPVTLKDHITWEEVAHLELHLHDLPGITIESGQSRRYLYPFETCHVLGYVASPSEQDLDGDPLLELPGFRIGKSGIEKMYDLTIRGKPGLKQVEVNATRRVVRELSTTQSTPGEELKLTLDLELQRAVAQRLAQEESAAAVVMDIRDGAVLSYLSSPGYDNNLFVDGISKTDWQGLLDHPRHVLMNKPLAGQYSPGSPFKMIVALAALEAGVITPQTSVCCIGHVMLGDHPFHCHRKGGHGTVTLENAIAYSCDVYFYHIASIMGIDAIADMAKRFGFGAPTGIDLPGEKSGLVPSRSWKRMVMGKGWSMGETFNASIGQGYVLATLMQLANMTAMLANGGKHLTPYIVQKPDNPERFIKVNPKHLELVLSGMNKVVNMPGGTSFNYRITTPGMEMAGKTGTTQVRRISEKDRKAGITSTASKPWHHREHALFVGYAPVHAPRFAAAVLVEHGGSGGKVAAPIGRDILMSSQILINS